MIHGRAVSTWGLRHFNMMSQFLYKGYVIQFQIILSLFSNPPTQPFLFLLSLIWKADPAREGVVHKLVKFKEHRYALCVIDPLKNNDETPPTVVDSGLLAIRPESYAYPVYC